MRHNGGLAALLTQQMFLNVACFDGILYALALCIDELGFKCDFVENSFNTNFIELYELHEFLFCH